MLGLGPPLQRQPGQFAQVVRGIVRQGGARLAATCSRSAGLNRFRRDCCDLRLPRGRLGGGSGSGRWRAAATMPFGRRRRLGCRFGLAFGACLGRFVPLPPPRQTTGATGAAVVSPRAAFGRSRSGFVRGSVGRSGRAVDRLTGFGQCGRLVCRGAAALLRMAPHPARPEAEPSVRLGIWWREGLRYRPRTETRHRSPSATPTADFPLGRGRDDDVLPGIRGIGGVSSTASPATGPSADRRRLLRDQGGRAPAPSAGRGVRSSAPTSRRSPARRPAPRARPHGCRTRDPFRLGLVGAAGGRRSRGWRGFPRGEPKAGLRRRGGSRRAPRGAPPVTAARAPPADRARVRRPNRVPLSVESVPSATAPRSRPADRSRRVRRSSRRVLPSASWAGQSDGFSSLQDQGPPASPPDEGGGTSSSGFRGRSPVMGPRLS